MNTVKVRAHVLVSGRVQGVFFRSGVAEVAETLGLTGWVRNLHDGRVEAVFEGEKEKVEKAVEFCRGGPAGARVQDLGVEWQEWRDEFSNFKIMY